MMGFQRKGRKNRKKQPRGVSRLLRSRLIWLTVAIGVMVIQFPDLPEQAYRAARPLIDSSFGYAPPSAQQWLKAYVGGASQERAATPAASGAASTTTSKVQWVENPFYAF